MFKFYYSCCQSLCCVVTLRFTWRYVNVIKTELSKRIKLTWLSKISFFVNNANFTQQFVKFDFHEKKGYVGI